MKSFSSRVFFVLTGVVLCSFLFGGCGITGGKLKAADQRIEKLIRQGVPDSVIETAKMLVLDIRSAMQYGGGKDPQKLYDSLMVMLDKTETAYASTTNALKPGIIKKRTDFDGKRQTLTGMQLQEADRVMGKLDSLIGANKWPDEKKQCNIVDTVLQSLVVDEQRAQTIKPKLLGTWAGTEHITDNGANAIEKTVFVFAKDGMVEVIEEHTGKNDETQKADWKFHSKGMYDVKGDTAFLTISHEQCLKQIYWNLMEKGGKTFWEKTEKPAYDSTITSGKKDRFITFAQISKTYKKR
jgi:hypothetical protein